MAYRAGTRTCQLRGTRQFAIHVYNYGSFGHEKTLNAGKTALLSLLLYAEFLSYSVIGILSLKTKSGGGFSHESCIPQDIPKVFALTIC